MCFMCIDIDYIENDRFRLDMKLHEAAYINTRNFNLYFQEKNFKNEYSNVIN